MSTTSVLLTTFVILSLISIVGFKGRISGKGVRVKETKNSDSPPNTPPAQSLHANKDWFAEIVQRDKEIMRLQMEISRKDLCETRPLEGRLMEANYLIEELKKENEELKRKINKESLEEKQ